MLDILIIMADFTCGKSDYERLRSECTASPDVIATLMRLFPTLTQLTIICHLLLCENNLEKTAASIEECQLWRQTSFPLAACPYSQAGKDCVLYIHGCDVYGHPLFVYTPRLNDPKTRNLEELVRWFLYLAEVALVRLPPNVAQITVLINRLNMEHGTDFEFVKRVGYHCRHHYPARVFKVIFYPVSRTLQAAWGVMKSVVSRRFADSLRMKHDLDALRRAIPDEYIPAELGGSCTYQFDMKDFPSPFAENYDSMIAGFGSNFPEGAMNGEAADVDLEDLYYPDTGDNVDALAITQASVGAHFSYQARPIKDSAPSLNAAACGSSVSPSSPTEPELLLSPDEASREVSLVPDHELLRQECTASPKVLRELRQRFGNLTEITIIRHLIICDYDLERTAKHIQDGQLWRQTMFPLAAMPYSRTQKESLLYCHGYDHQGRPLLIFTPRLNDPKNRNLEELFRFVIYMLEVAIKRLPSHLVQVTVLVNRETLGMKLEPDFEFFRRINEVITKFYPVRIRRMLFYPVSTALRGIWRAITAVVHGRSVRHMRLIDSLAELKEYIPDEYIPAELGGSCTYQFDMKDFPSPFAENYDSMIAGFGSNFPEGAMNGEAADVDLEDLYYPDTGDNVDALAITQASVGAHFSHQARPINRPDPANLQTI